MLPIDPAELSAFLDGELTPNRAEVVQAALARDPVLRQTYERLARFDVDWKARAATTMFQPRVRFNRASIASSYLATASVIIGLLLLRVALKALPPAYATGLASILLALVVGWGLRRIMRATDADRSRIASQDFAHVFLPSIT
jgi:anti-sigma factor RsiW